jgi:hypothetical protein
VPIPKALHGREPTTMMFANISMEAIGEDQRLIQVNTRIRKEYHI